jgi:general secretion pathway protein K
MKRETNKRFSRLKLADNRGVALIVVLWIFIFLFVVAFEFSTAAREEASGAHRFSEETQGYYLAVAAFERGLYDFLRQPSGGSAIQQDQRKSDPFDGEWREENVGAGAFRVRLIDEGGKININRVSEETLRRVLTNLGLDPVPRDVLVDSIMDWRDPDDLHRANGAETDYYSSLSPAYTAKNGPLDSVAELLWIKGVTRELLFGVSETIPSQTPEPPRRIALRDIFTVDSPIDRVNLRTATPEVIHALTGISLERCRKFTDERKKLSNKTLGDLLPLLGIATGDATLQMFIFTNPSVVAVEAEGRAANRGAPRRVKGVVRIGGAQGFELMRWLDRDTALPES